MKKLRDMVLDRIDVDFVEYYKQYPTAGQFVYNFINNPFSGNGLRAVIEQEDGMEKEKHTVPALEAPVMWNSEAPIVITQYVGYQKETLPRYWKTTLPDIHDKYGSKIRYEHHDVPIPVEGKLEYKLATIGRRLQHMHGNDLFWEWFNLVMVVDQVTSIDEAYQLVNNLDDVDMELLKEGVEYSAYDKVFWNDIYELTERASGDKEEKIEEQIDNTESVFELYINGENVDPSYDSMVGRIEDVL